MPDTCNNGPENGCEGWVTPATATPAYPTATPEPYKFNFVPLLVGATAVGFMLFGGKK